MRVSVPLADARTSDGDRATKPSVDVRPFLPLAAATALHLAMLAMVGTTGPSPPLLLAKTLPSMGVDLAPDEVDVARVRRASRPSGANAPASMASHDARLDRASAKVAPPSALSEKAGPSQEEALPAPREPAGSAWTFSPSSASSAAIDLRAGVTPDLVAPAHSSELPAGASVTGGLAEGLVARDVELGLGRGGPVLTAVEEAARMSDDPVDGNATFGVSVFSDGAVVATLLGASSHSASWSRVADTIGHTLRSPPHAAPSRRPRLARRSARRGPDETGRWA